MEYIGVLIVAAAVFGLCFLVDKGFTKLFRSQAQHKSGLAVRLNKKYGAFGLILFGLGLAGIFAGLGEGWVLIAGGALICVVGVGLVVYYMTCAIYYDEDSFLYCSFGKKDVTYRYADIAQQRLYVVQGGGMIVELYMTDGRTVQVQSQMIGYREFLNYAFAHWCRQKNMAPESCEFHDPDNGCWFPAVEET